MKEAKILNLHEHPMLPVFVLLLKEFGRPFKFDADTLNVLPPYFSIAAEFEEDGGVTKAITLSIVGSSEAPPMDAASE